MDDKKLDLILSKVEKIDKLEIHMLSMETDIQGMKTDMQDMKTEMQSMKSDIKGLKSRADELDRKVQDIQLHLENRTDWNIQLLAENFIELTNKLNQAIPVADKNLAYEVKVSYLIDEVQKMKEKMEEKIAAGDFVTA